MGPKGNQSQEEGSSGQLNIWITNADVLTQEKLLELKSRMKENPPDLIAISEVKPKNWKYHAELVQYALDGYEMDFVNLNNDTGRGMIMYISTKLDFNILAPHTFSTITEALLVEIKMLHGKFLFCSMYRSPNSTKDNNDGFNALLGQLANSGYKYIVATGDMNYPKIDWEFMTTKSKEEDKDYKFVEAVRDSFMTQIVDRPTRGKVGS